MRVTPTTILPDLSLVRCPADSVQQPSIALRMNRNVRGDDLTRLEVGDLHSPEVSHIVDGVIARAVYCIRSEDSRIRPDAGYRIGARIDQVQVMAAPVVSLCLL